MLFFKPPLLKHSLKQLPGPWVPREHRRPWLLHQEASTHPNDGIHEKAAPGNRNVWQDVCKQWNDGLGFRRILYNGVWKYLNRETGPFGI